MVDLSQTEVDACVNIVNCAQSPWHAMLSNIYSLPQALENMMTSAQPNDDVIFNAIKCKTRVANFQLLPSWPTPCPGPLFHSQISVPRNGHKRNLGNFDFDTYATLLSR